jgi:hypothetical protein
MTAFGTKSPSVLHGTTGVLRKPTFRGKGQRRRAMYRFHVSSPATLAGDGRPKLSAKRPGAEKRRPRR